MVLSRNHTYWVEESQEWVTTLLDISWDELRFERNNTLNHSDWRFMSDQTPSQEWIDYRQFLRDLPQNYETANEAADAWNEYNIPE
tara:strand:- start:959 stop:1216 length:258 start_codon:yes stop_codon:yes gene_type:complete